MKIIQHKLKSIIGITILALAFLSFANAPSAKASGNSSLSFSPSTRSINTSSSTTLDAVVNPGPTPHSISSVSLPITYDQTKLSLTAIACSSTFSTELYKNLPSTQDGTAQIDCAVPGGTSAVTTTTTVATFSFTALTTAVSNSAVAFTAASSIGADDDLGVNVFDGDTTTGRSLVTVTDSGSSDTTPPVLSNGTPSGTLALGTTSTTVGVTTDENATCKYSASAGTDYASMTGTFTTGDRATAHSFTATGLSDGNTYNYYVRCQDSSANLNTNTIDYVISFSIGSSSSNNSSSSSSDKNKSTTKPRTITESKKSLSRGQVLTQRGKKFSKKAIIQLYFMKAGGAYYPPMKVTTSSSGSFMVTYTANKPAGTYYWYALDTKTGKKSRTIYYRVK
jgi:hypothetical protein